MSSGIFLPFSVLSEFSPPTQSELMEYIKAQIEHDSDTSAEPHLMEEDEDLPDLSVSHARKFLDRVSDKVRTTIRMISEADASGFNMTDIMKELGVENPGDMRGVWGGITKRVRSVLGDESAMLIGWVRAENGDWIGRVSPMTHRSFRKVLDIH